MLLLLLLLISSILESYPRVCLSQSLTAKVPNVLEPNERGNALLRAEALLQPDTVYSLSQPCYILH